MILLGIGFTTRRLAKRLLARGDIVYGVARTPERFADLKSIGLRVTGFSAAADLPKHSTLVHSIPPLAENEWVHSFIEGLSPRRMIYISATSVYGNRVEVDETTAPEPSDEKSVARYREEEWLLTGSRSNLIIRPAAIYGPGRGVQEKVREGKQPRGAASGVVSRIHADDLAAVLEAAARSELRGAFPLADDRPCGSEEVVNYCARLLGIETRADSALTFTVAGRRVDGRKIRALLGVELLYPSYESGILAACSRR